MMWGFLLACGPRPPLDPKSPLGSGWDHPVAEAVRDTLPPFLVEEGHQVAPEVPDGGACFGDTRAWSFDPGNAGVVHLGRNDAVVYVGHTPPASRYFSLTASVQQRSYDDGERRLDASIARSLNFQNLNHDGPTPFEELVVIIASGSPTTAFALRQQLEAELAPFVDADVLNILELPFLSGSALEATLADPAYATDFVVPLRPGYDAGADAFAFSWCVVGADPDASFLDGARLEGAVFRVHAPHIDASTSWVWPHLPPQRDAFNGPSDAVAASLANLAEAVRAELPGQALLAPFEEPVLEGFRCIEEGVRCANSDDVWGSSSAPVALPLDVDGGLVAVGAVHPQVLDGPALAYSSLELMQGDRSVLGWGDEELRGTARQRFPDGVPGVLDAHLDAFFVVEVAPTCSSPPCIPMDATDGADFHFAERAVLDLSTRTGPHPTSVLHGRLIAWGPEVTYLEDERRIVVQEEL